MSDQNSNSANPTTTAAEASAAGTITTVDAQAAPTAAAATAATEIDAQVAAPATATSAAQEVKGVGTTTGVAEQDMAMDANEDMQHRNLETAVVLTASSTDSKPGSQDANTAANIKAAGDADAPVAMPSNIVGSAELSEDVLGDDGDMPVSSGSAVHILNKIIEVVEDEEADSSEDVKMVLSASEEAAAKAAEEEEKAKAKAAEEAGEEAAPKEDLTITDPLPVAKQEYDAATDEDEYPELSAEDQERYNKMMLKEGDACPACGKGTLILRQNDRVAFLGCSCFPQCKLRYYTSRSNAVVSMKTLESTCPQCGAPLEVKKGRYGLFIGCSDYPQCTYVYKDEAVHDEIECPVCKKGTLERRRARSGRIFFGCNHYPECEFIVPGIPVQSPCKECGFPIRYKKKVKAGIALVCANPECASRRRRKQEIIES